jgi:hypothetical protein
MSEPGRRPVLIVNPLKRALAHYEVELLETLSHSGANRVEIAETVPGDRVKGVRQRVAVAARTVSERIRMARSLSGQIIIVTWPLFGYLDPLTLLNLARRNTLYLIVHDPFALRRSSAESAWTGWIFKRALRQGSIRVLYHSVLAQYVGARHNGVAGLVVPHPVCLAPSRTGEPLCRTVSRPVVRVLGQYKHTRSLTALSAIADQAAGSCELEIHGRGWPYVPGWAVTDQFVPEHEFTALVESSDCVVIPYDSFFQSGVAVRCFEAGVPVVAPQHEQIAQLYGDDWVGAVADSSDWYAAVLRALGADAAEIRSRHDWVAGEVRGAWDRLLSTTREVTRD